MSSYLYCPCCAGELIKKKLDHQIRSVCSKCGFVFYRNSKPCVAAIVIRGGKVLLTRRGIQPYQGDWDLPGGFLEYGENPKVGLKRELREELGLACKREEFFEAFVDRYGKSGEFTLSLYYVVTPTGRIKKASDDVSEYAFFALDDLPRNIAFPSVRRILKKLKTLCCR